MPTRKYTILASIVLVGCVIASAHHVYAQVMTGTLYKVQSDSLSFGGGRSTSTTYVSENTFGEIATGESTSTTYKIGAGYQQMQAIYISTTLAADVTMSPSLGGITGGTSNGQTSFTITTDNKAGYTVTIKASSSPAMQSPTSSIANYTPAGADPDYNFSIASTDSEFAFSPEGSGVVQRFKNDTNGNCNVNVIEFVDKCWAPIPTTPETIVSRSTANHPSGTATTLKFRAQIGTSHVQEPGVYVATTTVTILPQ